MIRIFNAENISVGQYRKAYPELDTMIEFEPLREDELMVVWWFANETSPLVEIEDIGERIKLAAAKVYNDTDIAESFAKNYIEGVLTNQDIIDEAIERMKQVNPAARARAYGMVEKMFSQYEEALDKDMSEFKKADGSLDSAAFVRVRQIIRSELPKLVEQIETGFGTHKNKEVKDRAGHQNIDSFLKNKEASGIDQDKLD